MNKQEFNLVLRNQFKSFGNLWELIWKAFIKDFRNILFMIIVPIFFTSIFYFLLGRGYGAEYGAKVILAYALLPCLTTISSLPSSIIDWKNSVFLKRIDVAGIKKTQFIITLWSIYLISSVVSFFIVLIYGIAYSAMVGQSDYSAYIALLGEVNWGFLILSVILISAMSIAIGTLLGGIFSSNGVSQGVVMMVYFATTFFSGVMLPPEAIMSTKSLVIFTDFIPHKYPVFIYHYVINDMSWSASFNTLSGTPNFTQTWQPVIGSFGLLVLIFLVTVLTFKWIPKK